MKRKINEDALVSYFERCKKAIKGDSFKFNSLFPHSVRLEYVLRKFEERQDIGWLLAADKAIDSIKLLTGVSVDLSEFIEDVEEDI